MYLLLMANRHLSFGGMEVLHVIFNEDGTYKETKTIKIEKLKDEVRSMMEVFSRKRK